MEISTVLPGIGFPFGRPLAPCEPAVDGPRPVLVLGAHARALQVRWQPPRRLGRAEPVVLAVDTEPEPWWDGNAEDWHVRRWRRAVEFRPEWGTAVSAGSVNGRDARKLRRAVLEPIGVDREAAWFAYCSPVVSLERASLRRVTDTFDEAARELTLPRLQPYLARRGRDATASVLQQQAGRLVELFRRCRPELVITVGEMPGLIVNALAVREARSRGEEPRFLHDWPLPTLTIAGQPTSHLSIGHLDRPGQDAIELASERLRARRPAARGA